jgi:ATP-dependent DNA helicase RecG
MVKKEETFNPRLYMELAIEKMKKSIQEPRTDKTSPKVGAVLIKDDGTVDTAYRGELRHGDHAEFSLLERKNRHISLDGAILFTTLEPCAPGSRKHPKLGCAERIVNARIKKVWIGIEDPDPTVDRKGIKYLLDHNIEVDMFDADLQEEIRKSNKIFIEEAEERAKKSSEEKKETKLTPKENIEEHSDFDDLSINEISRFLSKADIDANISSQKFRKIFSQLGLIEKKDDIYKPTGIGLLLFGNRPQFTYQNALIRAIDNSYGNEKISTIEGSLIKQAEEIEKWYKKMLKKGINRDAVIRKDEYEYPTEVLREAIINAIVHRDYDLEGAPIYFEINNDAIIIKSPGKPVEPIKIEQIKNFNAPSLCRNPKIMYIFDQLDLAEQRGLGFKTIKDLPGKYEKPLPIVTWENPYLVFTFPRDSKALKKLDTTPGLQQLNEEELKGYEWIKTINEVSARDYSNHFNFSDKKAQRHLSKMKQLGLLTDNGLPLTSHNYKYIVKT